MSWTDTTDGDPASFVGMVEGMLGFELDSWQASLVEQAFDGYRTGRQLTLPKLTGRRTGFELLQRARYGDNDALFDATLIIAQLDPEASVRRIVAQHSDELLQLGVTP